MKVRRRGIYEPLGSNVRAPVRLYDCCEFLVRNPQVCLSLSSGAEPSTSCRQDVNGRMNETLMLIRKNMSATRTHILRVADASLSCLVL